MVYFLFNFLFLASLPYYEEHIKGEQILSDYVDLSRDINTDVTLTENKLVTIFFDPLDSDSNQELLRIVLVDPQNKKYTFDKELHPYIRKIRWSDSEAKDYLLFTPKESGVHHIEMSNATSFTDIEIYSGMTNPYQQPSFMSTLFLSFVITLTGLFSLDIKGLIESIYSGKIAIEVLYCCLVIPISWIIVNSVVIW